MLATVLTATQRARKPRLLPVMAASIALAISSDCTSEPHVMMTSALPVSSLIMRTA